MQFDPPVTQTHDSPEMLVLTTEPSWPPISTHGLRTNRYVAAMHLNTLLYTLGILTFSAVKKNFVITGNQVIRSQTVSSVVREARVMQSEKYLLLGQNH